MRLNFVLALTTAVCMTALFAPQAAAQSPTHASNSLQGTWVYNPDANANGNIATYDLMELLSIFGQDVDVPAVVPAETVDELTAQVALLSEALELQTRRMAAVVRAIREMRQNEAESPFKWDPELGAWVCTDPVVVDAGLSAGAIHTNRITAGSGQFGGMDVD